MTPYVSLEENIINHGRGKLILDPHDYAHAVRGRRQDILHGVELEVLDQGLVRVVR